MSLEVELRRHKGKAEVLRYPLLADWAVFRGAPRDLAQNHDRLARWHSGDERGANIYGSEALEVVSSTRRTCGKTPGHRVRPIDQRVSFTDCISFAMMKRLGIRVAFTFDTHFELAGFERIG